MQRAGTLQEIAKALNLSTGTVSRVLNGRGDLAPATRVKVFELAAELKYVPRRRVSRQPEQERLVRLALCMGNTCLGTDGMMDPSFFGFHLLAELQRVAGEEGVGVMASFVDAASSEVRIEHLPVCKPGNVQGIVLVYPFPELIVRRLEAVAPLVSVEHVYAGLSLDVVGPTHALDAMRAVEYLHQLGHRRIGYVGDDGATGHRLTQGLRYAGFLSGLARMGMAHRAADVLNVGERVVSKQDLPGEVAKRIADGVTAVITSIDRHGYLLWDALPRMHGIDVPRKVALVGIGGIFRAEGQPQLTTFRCDYEAMARAALVALRSRIAGERRADLHQEFPSKFTPGGSTLATPRP